MGRSSITQREIQVIKLLANGLTATEAAKELNIAAVTVDKRTRDARLKLDANNIAHLIAICFRNSLLKLK